MNDLIKKKLDCNLGEVTIQWGEVKEFQYIQNTTYKTQDIADDILTKARKRKSDKYEKIEDNMKNWLEIF
jgi:hypothetical protein